MKKLLLLECILLALFAFVSCGKQETLEKESPYSELDPSELTRTDSWYGYAEITVPAAVETLLVDYLDAQGDTVHQRVPVRPVVVRPTDGKDVEPFGSVRLVLYSGSQPARVNVRYEMAGRSIPVLENFLLDRAPADAAALTKADIGLTEVFLEEPAPYVTGDAFQTFYHSSGVVMFEDSWPNMNYDDRGEGFYQYDYNDLVVDYDLEACTVADDMLETDGWREQLKVVLHVRALGSKDVWRVGLILENFDQQWVESIDGHMSLDSWQNPHGELPSWTVGTLQENSLHYESNPLRPCIEIGGLHRIIETTRGAGTEEYTRIDDNGNSHTTVFNPSLKQWSEWQTPHTEQYDAALASLTFPRKLSDTQKFVFYNTIPGYVNVDGGLYTYTVIYHLKPRAAMDDYDREVSRQNLLNAVMNTTNQNFYITLQDYRPIGLKGYQPGDFAIKISPGVYGTKYSEKYAQVVAANSDKLDPSISYVSRDGHVWAFKCPVLTKHVWEKYYFSLAYPRYEAWIGGDASAADWYLQSDGTYLSCWW